MSEDSTICPVCDTPNEPGESHCFVCGERLPATGGTENAVSENPFQHAAEEPVMEMAPESSSGEEVEVEVERPAFGMASENFESEASEANEAAMDESPEEVSFEEESAEEDAAYEEASFEEEEFGGDELSQEMVAAAPEIAEDFEAVEEEPEFLYSSDGTAYPKGSPEYEEGFGPMGDELVASAPEPAGIETATDAVEDYPEVAEESATEAVPAERSGAFDAAFKVREKAASSYQALPTPGAFMEPATLTLYVNREPVLTYEIETDETLLGRRDPVADAYPDIDFTDWDAAAEVSRKHVFIYRQNKNYTLYVVSNAGTQLNSDILSLGDRRPLKDGDIIVLAGKFALKFQLP